MAKNRNSISTDSILQNKVISLISNKIYNVFIYIENRQERKTRIAPNNVVNKKKQKSTLDTIML